ncbi:glycosyltransferase family 39 protein [Mycobacterium sp. GA-1285]|uniref:glycosyltransferase family 39 protein n=1 Tax=Mycobacterium sp. GA-1285 TaxID=1772282 RepID=UPI0015609525|nr:glycosyltransferase family 39 protein [Mycobacterium sp. GA-1285]
MAGILCFCIGWPVFLAVFTGSLEIPHNDAWAYSLIAERHARSGSIELVGWNRAALIGQIVILGPLGQSIVAQQLFVAALATCGLLATYGLLVPRIGRSGALLGTALVGLTPDFGLLTTSYMAEIPAFTAVVACLFLTDRALRVQDARYLLGALAIGTWGVTVREQAIVGPVVAVAVTLTAWRGRKRRIALLAGMFSALVIAVFEVWRRSLPHDGGAPLTPLGISTVLAIATAVAMCFFVALAVFPVVLISVRPRRWSRRAQRISVGVFVLTALVAGVAHVFGQGNFIFLSNYLTRDGAYTAASIGTRHVLPDWWWFTLVVMACVSLALIVGQLIDSGIRLDRMLGLVLLLTLGGTLAQVVLGQPAFGRSLLILIPVACVALLGCRATDGRSPPPVRRKLLPVAAVAILAATSTAVIANALAFDAARWHAASKLVARGVAHTDINAGFEWVGYHAAQPASWSSADSDAFSWYMSMFEHSRNCYVVSASPLHGLRLISTEHYRTYALAGSSNLWIYQTFPCHRPGTAGET